MVKHLIRGICQGHGDRARIMEVLGQHHRTMCTVCGGLGHTHVHCETAAKIRDTCRNNKRLCREWTLVLRLAMQRYRRNTPHQISYAAVDDQYEGTFKGQLIRDWWTALSDPEKAATGLRIQ